MLLTKSSRAIEEIADRAFAGMLLKSDEDAQAGDNILHITLSFTLLPMKKLPLALNAATITE